MCGIFGSIWSDREVDVNAALASIRYRGPDHAGHLRVGEALLGFVRLAIIDLSPAGNQPMQGADDALSLVFNGEIYNHHVIRADLEARGYVFRTRSDSEVLIHGLDAYGDALFAKLEGMFAFAIWDRRAGRVTLARDRAGKKPLFYAMRGDELLFASEPKALFASGLERAINPSALEALLTFGYPPAPDTMYRGVFEVPPGTSMTATRGSVGSPRAYYTRPFCQPPLPVSAEEAIKETRRLVEQAVARRLEADVPLGAFLSGGVDSTIVVGAMATAQAARVKTFSIGFAGDSRYDETAYARLVARKFDTEHTEFRLEPSSFEAAEQLVHVHDAPFGDSSAIPTAMVSKLTRERVTVALSGDGGDELFCGYPRFLAGELAERLPRPLARGLGVVGPLLPRIMPRGADAQSRLNKLQRLSRAIAMPLAERLCDFQPYFHDASTWLTAGALASPQTNPVLYTERKIAASVEATPLARMLHHNYETYLPYDLLVKADRASMLHSLEVRSPFLDTDLVDYVSRLPDRMKRRGLQTKWILKEAFSDLLPKTIRDRKKMGFSIPLGAWFRGDLHGYIEDMFGPSARLFRYIREQRVRTMLAEHAQGAVDHGSRIWLLLTLEIWLRQQELPLAPRRS